MLGAVVVRRVYFACKSCSTGGYPADQRLGIDGLLTTEARRLTSLAGVQRSFANASMLLKEFCGWQLSDETIRIWCHAEADRVAEWREGVAPDMARTMAANERLEFQTDATKVNTTTGWRDLKIGLFCRRSLGPSSSLTDWEQRSLPKPSNRIAFAAIEEIDTFGKRWIGWSERLGIGSFETMSVIADGAEWIWNAATDCFPGHRGVLDIFHASEHLHATAEALHGEGSTASNDWFETARTALLGDGWYGIQEVIGRTLSAATLSDTGRDAIESLTRYLANHSTRLNYRARIACGEAIGSGQVEGACKQMIGKRMKQTGARWTVANANRMAELCSLSYSGQWNSYWMAA